jgi:hypothetical protein
MNSVEEIREIIGAAVANAPGGILGTLHDKYKYLDWHKAVPGERQYIGQAEDLNYRFVLSNLTDNWNVPERIEVSVRQVKNDRMHGRPIVRFEIRALNSGDQQLLYSIWEFVRQRAREPLYHEYPSPPPRLIARLAQ